MSDTQHHNQPNARGGGEQKRSVTGKMHVQGEIEVHLPPHIEKENAVANQRSNCRELIKMWVDGATLLTVVVYAGLTLWQAISSQTLADLSRQQMVNSERAWITVQQLSLAGDLTAGTMTPITFLIKNGGQTPATNVYWHSVIAMSGRDTDAGGACPYIPQPGDKRSTSVIWPGGTATNNSLFIGTTVTHYLEELKAGGVELKVYGTITYSDIFSQSDFTNFCAFYDPRASNLVACETGNDIDLYK